MLKLWLITRLDEQSYSYDDYISFVVCAEDAYKAIKITTDEHPTDESCWCGWTTADKLRAHAIGIALQGMKPGIIQYSFNAG